MLCTAAKKVFSTIKSNVDELKSLYMYGNTKINSPFELLTWELFCKEEMQISFPIMMTAGGILVIQGVPIAVTINDLPNEVPDDIVTLK